MAINQSKASHLIKQHPRLKTALDHLIHLIESKIKKLGLPCSPMLTPDRAAHFVGVWPFFISLTITILLAHTLTITTEQPENYTGKWTAYLEAWSLLAEASSTAPPRPTQLDLLPQEEGTFYTFTSSQREPGKQGVR